MAMERRVKLFRSGGSQAVRIPRAFELPGEDAIMRRESARIVIEPVSPRSLLALLAALDPIDEEFAPVDDIVPGPGER